MSTTDPLVRAVDRHQSAPENAARYPNVIVAERACFISPEQVHLEPAETPTDAGETLWTCPMHSQIIRTEPGFCPICGTALESMTHPGRRPKAPSFAT